MFYKKLRLRNVSIQRNVYQNRFINIPGITEFSEIYIRSLENHITTFQYFVFLCDQKWVKKKKQNQPYLLDILNTFLGYLKNNHNEVKKFAGFKI